MTRGRRRFTFVQHSNKKRDNVARSRPGSNTAASPHVILPLATWQGHGRCLPCRQNVVGIAMTPFHAARDRVDQEIMLLPYIETSYCYHRVPSGGCLVFCFR